MIALLSAMEEEMRDLKRGMKIRKTSSYQCCRIYEGIFAGRENLLVITGIGGEHARQVTQMILATYPISALISTGFGGGLNPKTAVGDIVVCTKLFNGDKSATGDQSDWLDLDQGLIVSSCGTDGKKDFKILIGNGVTVSQVCSTSQSKSKLGNIYNADIVDMESYFIGRAALEKHFPIIVVRSIFDTVQDDLTVLDNIMSNGKINPRRMLPYLLIHPGQTKSLFRYAGNSKKARRSLTVYLSALVEKIAI